VAFHAQAQGRAGLQQLHNFSHRRLRISLDMRLVSVEVEIQRGPALRF
jgi:hypothetical protein